MATHSSTLAWRIPWTEESGGLQSMGSQRVRYDLGLSMRPRMACEGVTFKILAPIIDGTQQILVKHLAE